MFFFDLVFVLILALVLTGIFAGGVRRQTERSDLVWFFLILFLMTWAFGGWITPFGPPIWGIMWFPFVITGIVIALLLTAFIEPHSPRTRAEQVRREQGTRKTLLVLDAFLWVLIIGLIALILFRYFA